VPWQVKNAAAPASDGDPELRVVGVFWLGQGLGVPLVEGVLKACLVAVGVKRAMHVVIDEADVFYKVREGTARH
jgi:hypothetical protein